MAERGDQSPLQGDWRKYYSMSRNPGAVPCPFSRRFFLVVSMRVRKRASGCEPEIMSAMRSSELETPDPLESLEYSILTARRRAVVIRKNVRSRTLMNKPDARREIPESRWPATRNEEARAHSPSSSHGELQAYGPCRRPPYSRAVTDTRPVSQSQGAQGNTTMPRHRPNTLP